jgi:hypothetical protein
MILRGMVMGEMLFLVMRTEEEEARIELLSCGTAWE